MYEPSAEFIAVARRAVAMAAEAPDDSVRYMAGAIPVYAQKEPDQQQRASGGCAKCVYLGLWAKDWPGLPMSLHGHIWLFEQGIRWMGGDLQKQTYDTLVHEMGHALERDHVLDQMERLKGRAAAQAYPPRGGCGGCR